MTDSDLNRDDLNRDRTWLITGAGRGIGRALTEAALVAGERVIATVRDPDALAQLMIRHSGHLHVEVLDVRDRAAVMQAPKQQLDDTRGRKHRGDQQAAVCDTPDAQCAGQERRREGGEESKNGERRKGGHRGDAECRSDSPPNSSSASRTPPAWAAKMIVSIPASKVNRSW